MKGWFPKWPQRKKPSIYWTRKRQNQLVGVSWISSRHSIPSLHTSYSLWHSKILIPLFSLALENLAPLIFSHPLFFSERKIFRPLNIFQVIFRPLNISRVVFRPLKFFAKNFAPLKKHSNRVSGLKKDRPLILSYLKDSTMDLDIDLNLYDQTARTSTTLTSATAGYKRAQVLLLLLSTTLTSATAGYKRAQVLLLHSFFYIRKWYIRK